MDKKLFAVMLGGRTDGAHIELHDLVFTVGNTLEETYPKLVEKWFGNTYKSLHIDASLELDIVDGYRISLSSEPLENETTNQLYCINFGGYQKDFFGEIHEVAYLVGNRKKDVVKRAKEILCVNTYQQHCDDNFVIGSKNLKKDVDDIIALNNIDGYYITLTPTTEVSTQQIQSNYIRLDTAKVLSQLQTDKAII
ncbi:MAG: DUF1543 domain-containing protein [Gammaproteobacteria bacterium]|nr:MAG: DUF1543 domain-containing protein [Gammaproteobacteria bacterium]UTW43602.1 DUF1543 domain-containing protein [bacterium SCSIO 12844]